MSTTLLETPTTEDERILLWRLERLERAGYDDLQSMELAVRHDIDLHLATDLLEDGCPAETALRILL